MRSWVNIVCPRILPFLSLAVVTSWVLAWIPHHHFWLCAGGCSSPLCTCDVPMMGTETPTHVRWSACGLLVSGGPCFGHEYSGLEFCAGSCSEEGWPWQVSCSWTRQLGRHEEVCTCSPEERWWQGALACHQSVSPRGACHRWRSSLQISTFLERTFQIPYLRLTEELEQPIHL